MRMSIKFLLCPCLICWHVALLLVFWVFSHEVCILCWLLHVASSPVFVSSPNKLASCVCVISLPTSTCFLRLLSFFFIFVLHLFQLHLQFLLFPVVFFSCWGFPFCLCHTRFCFCFLLLKFPIFSPLLCSCILLRFFHFLFVPVNFFRHTRVFLSCILTLSHNLLHLYIKAWSTHSSYHHCPFSKSHSSPATIWIADFRYILHFLEFIFSLPNCWYELSFIIF